MPSGNCELCGRRLLIGNLAAAKRHRSTDDCKVLLMVDIASILYELVTQGRQT